MTKLHKTRQAACYVSQPGSALGIREFKTNLKRIQDGLTRTNETAELRTDIEKEQEKLQLGRKKKWSMHPGSVFVAVVCSYSCSSFVYVDAADGVLCWGDDVNDGYNDDDVMMMNDDVVRLD